MNHDILIIGGGASGILSSILLKDKGLDVAILEGTKRIGNKILTTGNGRCNITNKFINNSRYHSENTDFFSPILNKYSCEQTTGFFYSLGLPLLELENGKMYPHSLQASSVLDIFRLCLEEKEIPIYLEHKVSKIIKKKNKFLLFCTNGDEFTCNKVIFSCGGNSAASTGSDGSGFKLAKDLGHSIIEPIPSLVQLKLDYKSLKALSGVKFDGYAEIYKNDVLLKKEFGEILFTDYGISGPPILQLSRSASYYLKKGECVNLSIDMMPNYSYEELKGFLECHFNIFSYRSVLESLIGIINKKLIPIILKESSIDNIHKPCSDLTWKEKNNLLSLMKSWKFKVVDTNGFKNSQVTAGGVNTKEVDNLTLESKLIKNLFFIGEVLDVDGDCGGFNLQWAWSSAFAVAENLK